MQPAPQRIASARTSILAAVAETPVTFALAALDVLVALWFSRSASFGDVDALVRFGALERSRVWAGEWWRLLTAEALHGGWLHLGLNVGFGIPWCRPVERALGPGRFLALYAASAVGASALSLLGRDAVSVGASGALFGVIGGALALHARALGNLGDFVRSRATRIVVGSIAAWSLVGLALPLDELGHAGGLATGAAIAWILTRPAPRRARAWLPLAAVLGAAVAAAVWPRHARTHYEELGLETAVWNALRAEDVPEARRLLENAATQGDRSVTLDYYSALLLVQEGELDRALAGLRGVLRDAPAGPLRDEARRKAAATAKLLGYRAYTGEGAAKDAARGLALFREACADGDAESCTIARRIGGR